MWRWQVWRTWKWHRFPLLGSVEIKFGRRCSPWKTRRAMRSRNCTDNFAANATHIFFPRMCYNTHKKHDKTEPGLLSEKFRCPKILCFRSGTYCCYDWKSNKYKFSSKGLSKRTLEDCGDRRMSKNRKILDESVNVTSTNKGFRAIQHGVATYDKTKKRLSNFNPKRIVEDNGIHRKPLLLWNYHSNTLSLFFYILNNFLALFINLFT